jgi:hypothetical protein
VRNGPEILSAPDQTCADKPGPYQVVTSEEQCKRIFDEKQADWNLFSGYFANANTDGFPSGCTLMHGSTMRRMVWNSHSGSDINKPNFMRICQLATPTPAATALVLCPVLCLGVGVLIASVRSSKRATGNENTKIISVMPVDIESADAGKKINLKPASTSDDKTKKGIVQ